MKELKLEYEKTIMWNDRDLDIAWPITATPLLSSKDKSGITLKAWNNLK